MRFSPLVLLAAAAHGVAAFPLFYREILPRCSAGVVGDIPIPAGFKTTVFSDGFDGQAGTLPSGDRWQIDLGTQYAHAGAPIRWGTGEVETMTMSPSNVYIGPGGTLIIKPIKTGVAANGRPIWTSARIETLSKWDFACALGKKLRIETRLTLGNSGAATELGIWMAVWSLGRAYRGVYSNWPAIGELDLMESINGQNMAYLTAHCGTANGGPCNEPTGLSTYTNFRRNAFHTVGLNIDRSASKSTADWRTEKITWDIDGKVIKTITGAQVNDQTAWTALAQAAKFLILDVAVGGAFPSAVAGVNTPTAATLDGLSAAMQLDYVAVFTT